MSKYSSMFVYNFPPAIQMFGRRQYLVNSRDRATGSATNFLYRLPNQMRDVVHVNLLHCIVENGVFNVDDTNNKFMLNQESNTLTDELGNAVSYADFPYLGNQLLVYNDGLVPSPVYWGVGKGGGALLWCSPDLTADPIQLDWAIKQPLNAQIWNNNIGNATELMCIASNQNGTIIVGGNNLVSQGYDTNFAISTDAFLGGDATFDTNYTTGGPSKSVNGIAYASIGGNPRWICTGDDSLTTTLTAIKIDDSNNQVVINIVDPTANKFSVSSSAREVIFVGSLNGSSPNGFDQVFPEGVYTPETYVSAMNSFMATNLSPLGGSLPFSAIEFEVSADGTVSAYAIVSEVDPTYPEDGNGRYYFTTIGMPRFLWGIDPSGGDGSGNLSFGVRTADIKRSNIGDRIPFQLYEIQGNSTPQFPSGAPLPTIQLGIPTSDLTTTIPNGNYNPTAFALEVETRINALLSSSPVYSVFSPVLQVGYDANQDSFNFRDISAEPHFSISLKQFGDTQNPVRVAFAEILGLFEGSEQLFETTLSLAPHTVGYNLTVPHSTWTSTDGIDWTAIKDPALANIVGHSISIIDTTTGPAVVVGTDDGIVYNNAIDLTTWSALKTTTNELSVVISYGKVYAVETTLNQSNDGVVVAFGCLGGQVYFDDDFWANPTPTPTKLITLSRSPNDFDPVCNAIKYTGNVSGNYPTWIFAGSSMSYITSLDPTLTGKTPILVPFNSGPAQDPSGYPFIEYINGIATHEEGGVLYTALGGDNTGQYSCTDITASATLDSWTGLQPFKNNVLIQIPTGYYTNTSLASTVAELLNNQVISGNGTFYTEVQTDGTFVVANTTSGNWGIRFMNGTLEYTGTAALLGFNDVSKQYEPSVAQGQDGPYTIKSDVEGGIDLVPFEYVLLQSDKFGNDLMTNSGLSAWWLVPNVANGVNSNSIVYENMRNPTLEYLTNPRDIEQFDIRVLNSNGEVIELQDNKNVTIVIEFYTKKAGCR